MEPVLHLDGETRVVGVIGWPVRHSLSPAMQNAALAQMGRNWIYVPFEVSPTRLAGAVEGMRALGLVGLNVTVPHKGGVAALVDELGETAQALGAVNTVHLHEGVLYGHNTDARGFMAALAEAGETVAGKRVALLGAGGAARSVAFAVAREGAARITVLNRTPGHADGVAELVRHHWDCPVAVCGLQGAAAEAAVREADLVVNCTSVGMYPHADVEPVVPGAWLREGQCVCDLIYTPRETVLLAAARERGVRTLDGTGMLVHQGAAALELWTGQRAPVDVMRAALLEALRFRESGGREVPGGQ
jgi:shikimate dehydrogenase